METDSVTTRDDLMCETQMPSIKDELVNENEQDDCPFLWVPEEVVGSSRFDRMYLPLLLPAGPFLHLGIPGSTALGSRCASLSVHEQV